MSNERIVLWICIPILVINLFRWMERDGSPATILMELGPSNGNDFEYKLGQELAQDLADGKTKEEIAKKYEDVHWAISNAEDEGRTRKKIDFVFYTLGCLAILWFCREIEQVSIGLGITTAASFFNWGCVGIEFIFLAPVLILGLCAFGFGKLLDKVK